MSDEEQSNDIENEAAVLETIKSRPAVKFSGTGGLSVAVWKSKSNEGRNQYWATLERSYKRADNTYANAETLRDSDLLRAQQLLVQADAWIEQDKGRGQRLASAASR